MMFHFIYSTDNVIRAIFSWDFNLYWIATDILRQFQYVKVGNTLRSLLRNEPLMRLLDVSQRKCGNTLILNMDQVIRLLDRIPDKHKNELFSKWFKDIVYGIQKLIPKNEDDFNKFLNYPEISDIILIACLLDTTQNSSAMETHSEEISSSSADRITTTFNENNDSAKDGNHNKFPYGFLLPELMNWMKNKYIPPVMTNSYPKKISLSTEKVNNNTNKHKNPNASEKQQMQNSSELEIDKSLSYDFMDVVFGQEYTFYAIKVNFMSETRSIAVNPFFKTIGTDNFLFVPVKKNVIADNETVT